MCAVVRKPGFTAAARGRARSLALADAPPSLATDFVGKDHGPEFRAVAAARLVAACYDAPRSRHGFKRIDAALPPRWPAGLALPGNIYQHGRHGWLWAERAAAGSAAAEADHAHAATPAVADTPFDAVDCSFLIDRPAADVWQFFGRQLGLSSELCAKYFARHQLEPQGGEPAALSCLLRGRHLPPGLGCQELALDLCWLDPQGYCVVDLELTRVE